MAIYIQAASSITIQNTYARKGFSDELIRGFEFGSELIEPDYKSVIDGALVRRLSKMNKAAMACMVDCLSQYPVEIFDGMILGTGLGCVDETEKFLKVVDQGENQNIISPIAFIQSGHNSVSGQLALIKKNFNYNMTHVQGGVSFENALIDATMFIREGNDHVLLGGIDERTELTDKLAKKMSLDKVVVSHLSQGSTFFIVGRHKETSLVSVVDVNITSDWEKSIQGMLHECDLKQDDIAMAFVGFNLAPFFRLDLSFPQIDYTKICGRYFTSSAFGVHMASDFLQTQMSGKHALVINFAEFGQVGLTLLRRE